MVSLVITIAVILLIVYHNGSYGWAVDIAKRNAVSNFDTRFLQYDCEALQGIMVAQVAALLAICVTVFVFLFTELNARAQDHPGEYTICNRLQKDFALRVERLSVDSIVLMVLNYWGPGIYALRSNNIAYGHALHACLMVASFWVSICMIWYCVDVAQYQRHLKWRAWDLTITRCKELQGQFKRFIHEDEDSSVSSFAYPATTDTEDAFWTEYQTLDLIVRTIVDVKNQHAKMTRETIDRFAEVTSLGNDKLDKEIIALLKGLYDYQAARAVYENYNINSADDTKYEKAYALRFTAWFLKLVACLVKQWNRVFRHNTDVTHYGDADRFFGHSPSAAEIAHGVRRFIICGVHGYSPMKSQRLHDIALSGLDFSFGALDDAVFSECRLVKSTFDNASLSRTLFDRCDLRGASFIDVDCKDLRFFNCKLSKSHIANSAPDNAMSNGEDADNRSDDTMKETVFIQNGTKSLDGVSFEECSMAHTVMEGSNKNKLNLSDSNYTSCDMEDVNIKFAKLDNCTLDASQAIDMNLQDCEGTSVNFAGTRFIGLKTGLSHCEFNRGNFEKCLFSGTTIENCKFPYLNATHTIFENPRIKDTEFCDASFVGASILYSTMHKTDFIDSNLSELHIIRSIIRDGAIERPIGQNLSLTYGRVYGVTITQASLPSSSFLQTIFKNCCFKRSSLNDSLLRDARFIKTNFVDTRLPYSDFSDARFRDLTMRSVIATGGIFDRVRMNDVTASGCLFDNASFRRSILRHCTFRSCKWKGADFEGARISDCSFSTLSDKEQRFLLHKLSKAAVLHNVYVDGIVATR